MGLLSFLDRKPKEQPKPLLHTENFITLAMMGVKDPEYRAYFYRRLLEIELFAVLSPDSIVPGDGANAEELPMISVLTLPSDEIALFSSVEYINDPTVRTLGLRGTEMLALFPGKKLAIDPVLAHGVQLTPELVTNILNGEVFRSSSSEDIDSSNQIDENDRRSIRYDPLIAVRLIELFKTMPSMEAAHLSVVKDSPRDTFPHWVVGVYSDVDSDILFPKLAAHLKGMIGEKMFVDFADLHDKRTHMYVKKGSKPFYSKHVRPE
jgi:hypothetical protein